MAKKTVKPWWAAYWAAREWGFAAAVVALCADWLTKAVVLDHAHMLPWPVIQDFFAWVLVWNYGMSFSFLNDPTLWWGPWLLGAVAVAAVAWFVHWLGESRRWTHQLGLGLIIGGAIGNLLDRIQHGAVVDFILVYHGTWSFPAFNLADSCITVGVILLLADTVCKKEGV